MSRVLDYTSMNSLETEILEICPNYQQYLNSNRFDSISLELSHAILNVKRSNKIEIFKSM